MAQREANECANHHETNSFNGPTAITIRKAWADALNPTSNTSDTSILAQFLRDGAAKAPDNAGYDVTIGKVSGIMEATLLSKAIADGLSRIGAEYRVNPLRGIERNATMCHNGWCSSGPFAIAQSRPTILNSTYSEGREFLGDFAYIDMDESTMLHSFPEPEDASSVWTRVSFPLSHYGYAWSFNTKTVKIATANLMLHALIIVIHCCFLLVSGRSYFYASSLGDLIALALNSTPPAAMESASVAIRKGASWTRPTAVRETRRRGDMGIDRVEIVTDDDVGESVEKDPLHRRLVPGKRYQ